MFTQLKMEGDAEGHVVRLDRFVTRRVEHEGVVGIGEFVFPKDRHMSNNKNLDPRQPLNQQRRIAVL